MRPCTVNDDIIIHSKTEQSILRVKNDIIILSPFLEAGHNSISVRLISYKRYLILLVFIYLLKCTGACPPPH